MKKTTLKTCSKIMKKTLFLMGLWAIGAAALTSVQAQSTNLIDVQILDDSIDIDYGGGGPNPLPVMTGAAVLGLPADIWNTVAASNLTYSSYPSGATIATPLPLNYADGTPSGISMTLSAPAGTYCANASNWGNYSPFTRAGSPYSALMQTLMVVGAGQSGSVTLTGLTVGQGYKLIFYTAGDQNVSGGREGLYTVNGNGQYYIWDGATTNLVSDVTYVEFDGVAPDSTGTLVIHLGNPTAETDMNGFQLIPVPGGPSASMINNISPDGSQFFENTDHVSFSILSASTGGAPLPTNPTNSIGVTVNGQNKTSQLQFSGTSTNWNVSLPGFTSNSIYTVGIVVTNSAGLFSSNSVTFDTYAPGIVVPVETYDFNGGQFIQNFIPTNGAGPTSYFGVTGLSNVDYSMLAGGVAGGGSTLAPNYPDRGDSNVAFQVASDRNLPLYQAQSNSAIYNVNLSYNNAGNWFNYTRNPWPSGYFIVYGRVSSGNGAPGGIGNYEALNIVTNGYGTANQITNRLGYFIIKNGGNWNSYSWVPLTDANGNVVPISIPSGQQTLQLLSGGGLNVVDFMFISIPTLGLPPVINNFNPPITTGGNVFVNSSTLTFSVSSLISTLAQSNIHVSINGSPVTPNFTGVNTNWNVSVPLSLAANQASVTFTISAVDANGLSNSISGTFDTFSQTNFMIEADAFDFNGGQYITNPVEAATTGDPNSYYYYPEGNGNNSAEYGIDYTTTNLAGETYLFRFDGNTPGTVSVVADAVGSEITSDFLRDKFINEGPGAQPPFEYVPEETAPSTNVDYDIGWWAPGLWINYTRTFPTNTYRVWGRLASGAVYTNATMSLVTAGRGTTSQTTQLLGTFVDTNASGFQAWHWIPLTGIHGQPVALSLGGTETLQLAAPSGSAGGSLNSHFYMFVPTVVAAPFSVSATVSGSTVSIKVPTQSGHNYTVYYSTSLTPPSWQALGSSIAGDGTVKTVTDSTTGGAHRFYQVVAQ
jgi:hypothetical protein